MKKMFFVVAFCFAIQSILAGYNTSLNYVINAYQYHRLSMGYDKIVPLFKPLSLSTGFNHLIIYAFPAETYYDKFVKSTENPTKTYHAYYSNGILEIIIEDVKEYRLLYDNEGTLIGYKCFDTNTGKLLNEKNQTITKNKLKIYEFKGKEYWYLLDSNEFFEHRGTKNKKGYMLSFKLAFKVSEPGTKQYALGEGYLIKSAEWFERHNYSSWKKGGWYNAILMAEHSDLFYESVRSWFDRREMPDRFIFNEIGLFEKKSISPSEALSQGVRDNVIYEYHWMK